MSNLKVGEDVMAKWSGSKRYFKGKVISCSINSVDVVFEDGTESTVKREEVEKIKDPLLKPKKTSSKPSSPKKVTRTRSRSRSAGRPAGEERSRSKSKTKSPARTPSSKSPKKPPSKKSPARSSTTISPSQVAPSKSTTRSTAKSTTRSTAKSPTRSTAKSPTLSPTRAKRETISSPKKSVVKKRESSISPERKSPRPRGRPSKASLSITSTSISTAGLKEFSIQAKKYDEKLEFNRVHVPLTKVRQPTNFKEKIALLEEEQKQQSEKIFVTRLRSAKQSILHQEARNIQSVDELDKVLSLQPPSPSTERDISFLRSLGSLIILFSLPVQIIFLILACARNQGKLFAIPFISKNWRFYITPIPTAVFFGFVLLQGLLQILPIGKVVEGFVLSSKVPKRNLVYRKNGLIGLLITISTIPIAIYFNKLPTEFIRAHFLHLATANIVFCIILAVSLYIKSFYAPPHDINPAGDTNFFYHNFVFGRQLNPRIGKTLDLKFLLFRIGLIGWAVIDILLLYKVYAVSHTVHCTLAMTAAMQLLYIVDLFWREEQLLSTATVLYEGVGFQLILGICAMNPFTSTLPVLYLIDRKTEMPYYCLVGITVLYLVGFYLSRTSNSVKYSVRKNPHALENQSLETISSNKKSLICSGPWGLVRHPNYLGDILLFLSWTLPCEFAAGVPYVPVVSVTFLLLWRIFQVEKRMEDRHRSSFLQYKNRVPKRLIPYIF